MRIWYLQPKRLTRADRSSLRDRITEIESRRCQSTSERSPQPERRKLGTLGRKNWHRGLHSNSRSELLVIDCLRKLAVREPRRRLRPCSSRNRRPRPALHQHAPDRVPQKVVNERAVAETNFRLRRMN